MTSRAALLTLLLLIPGLALSQGSTAPIDGVWKIAEVVTTGANPATNTSPQPSVIIFARGHYSWLSVGGTTPRKQPAAAATPGKLTDADKVARYEEWNPFTANTGTFEIKGSTLTRRMLVAKNVSVMSSTTPNVQEFKLEGDTLWLTGPAPGDPKSQTRFKLTRVR